MNNRCRYMYKERGMGLDYIYVIAITYVAFFLRSVLCKPFISLVRLFWSCLLYLVSVMVERP